jgi:unsaturated chondroitin disaccharide hydrolase
MKRNFFGTILGIYALLTGCYAQNIKTATVFSDAENQTQVMLQEIPKARKDNAELVSPRSLYNGELKLVASRDWTSGFFPGVLWFLYEYTGKTEWKQQAIAYTAKIEREKMNAGTHDMGFKIYCSFGTGYRLTRDPSYRDIIIQSAKTLSLRFNPVIGCIRSWDHNRDKWGFPVIIDNMMNLELLFAATQLTGDSSFYKIAVSHANTTMKNHFRSDYSSYHVIDYDTVTGKVVKKNTHQGYSHESAWSRGQAWGLYGYTMCYRFTKDKRYLEQAEKIAAFILNHPHMPKDLVPYYDFDAPGIPNEPRDASAAAVIASGLYELSQYNKQKEKEYRGKANTILKNLTNLYRSPVGENKGYLLLHSTGSKPGNSEVDQPLSYADYYYLEAILRSQLSDQKKKTAGKINVSSVADLQKAIDAATPGDIIYLKKGIYVTDADIVISKAGTASQPITIAAQEAGTEITGKGGFSLVSPAAYIIIKGFTFTHAASKAKSAAGTSFCQWTQNVFETPGTGEYLTIAGSDHQVDHNLFRNKDSLGRFLAIRGSGNQIAERLWIHHNYFKTQKSMGGRNGAEALQFGLSGLSLSSSNSIVENNLFEDCNGENELISIKASRVTVRYNTIRNCPAQFTLRHGNFCEVYGNYFINTPGLRIFGDDHIIHSNHFENCSVGINIGNGGAEVADGAPLTSHDRPDRVLIVFNTLVNNKTNIAQTARNNGLGSTYITIANNIIQGGAKAASIVGPTKEYVWAGNIIFNTEGAGDMPEGSYVNADPKLVKDARKEFHKGSLIITPVKVKVLQPSDVGPKL